MPALTATGLVGTHLHGTCGTPETSSPLTRALANQTGKSGKAALGRPEAHPSVVARGGHARTGCPLNPSGNLRLDWSDLAGAPGRIRTRDPLLRRQLLCPAELRAPGNKCALRMSHDGYTKVAVSSPDPVHSSPEVKPPCAKPLAAQRVPQPAVIPAERVKSDQKPRRRQPGEGQDRSRPAVARLANRPDPTESRFHWRAAATMST
jgi:hypothetical protein